MACRGAASDAAASRIACYRPIMIVLRDVSKSYDRGKTHAVQSVSLSVETGQTLVLLGSSGCGKTTTLKMINRLIEPTGGEILVDGTNILKRNILELRRSIGYVFQNIGLFPHMSVWENASIVPRLLNWPKPKRRARAEQLLRLVGLEPDEYADRRPSQLSGGQQQRVGLARALATDPKYLLMDEPFGALDAVTRDALQAELIDLRQRFGKTIVFVTHDLFEAIRLGDRIAVMNEGRVEQLGSADELINTPATDFVRDLFKQAQRQADLLETESNATSNGAGA